MRGRTSRSSHGFAILGGEDHVKDDLTERLRHGGMMKKRVPEVNRAFSANEYFL
jgi:hypothetical protein